MTEGTLAMPTHTYCYPDEGGGAPVFDPAATRSCVGAVTEAFWREPGVLRSRHPTHSLAAVGPLASSLIKEHESADTPCGAGTPYEKLVCEDAGVLMFGVTLNSYTLFHTAEALARVPYLYYPQLVTLRMREPDGRVRSMNVRRQDMRVARRFVGMDAWLEERGWLHRIRCGGGTLLWLPHARTVHEALLTALQDEPWLLVAGSARPATC
jgi:aminoglycoside 3-N-acetyltransferase